MQRQHNLINDLIRAADGLQNLNANTQQLQNRKPQPRSISNNSSCNKSRGSFQRNRCKYTTITKYTTATWIRLTSISNNPPAANRVVLSNEKTASSKFHNYSMRLICYFYCFYLYFFSYYSLLLRHFKCNFKNFSHISLT